MEKTPDALPDASFYPFTPFLYERNRTDQPNRCQLLVAELMPVYDRKLLKVLQVLR